MSESQARGAWFEELVRVALAAELGLPLDRIVSTHLPGATFPGSEPPNHQIDLYIVAETPVSVIDTIVECRWRGPESKVDQGDVQGVIAVRESTGASKAIIVTNTGFTEGAERLATANKVGLTVICPQGPAEAVPVGDRASMRSSFAATFSGGSSAPYAMKVVTRALPPGSSHVSNAPPQFAAPTGAPPLTHTAGLRPAASPSPSTGVSGTYMTRVVSTGGGGHGGRGGGFRRG